MDVLHIRLPLRRFAIAFFHLHLTFCLFFFLPVCSVCFFRLPHATQFHPHRQLHLRLQPDCGDGVSCCFVSYSVQSVLGGFVGGCVRVVVVVGRRGQSWRMWNARIHVHCYLHLLLHLWSAVVAVHWQWVVVVVVVVLVFEVLEVETVEMWVWDWRLCMHRSGSEIDSSHVRMNVQFGHLHAHFAQVRRISALARSVAHSNLPRDHDTLALRAQTAEAVAHGVRVLDSDGDGKSCPYHIGTHWHSSAGFGLCSSRDTGIVRVLGKSELS